MPGIPLTLFLSARSTAHPDRPMGRETPQQQPAQTIPDSAQYFAVREKSGPCQAEGCSATVERHGVFVDTSRDVGTRRPGGGRGQSRGGNGRFLDGTRRLPMATTVPGEKPLKVQVQTRPSARMHAKLLHVPFLILTIAPQMPHKTRGIVLSLPISFRFFAGDSCEPRVLPSWKHSGNCVKGDLSEWLQQPRYSPVRA